MRYEYTRYLNLENVYIENNFRYWNTLNQDKKKTMNILPNIYFFKNSSGLRTVETILFSLEAYLFSPQNEIVLYGFFSFYSDSEFCHKMTIAKELWKVNKH